MAQRSHRLKWPDVPHGQLEARGQGGEGEKGHSQMAEHPSATHSQFQTITGYLHHPQGPELPQQGFPSGKPTARPPPAVPSPEHREVSERQVPNKSISVPWSARTRMMFPGTLNSSTLQPSASSVFAGGIFLFWKIRQSTDGTGTGILGLGLVLRPKDFNSKLSCKLKSIPRLTLRRAQARPALKLAGEGRGPITVLLPQTKSCAGDPLAGH